MVLAFRRALLSQHEFLHGKIVLDLTSFSSGLYSMMSARAGAAEVYCVEKSETEANRTRAVIRNNGFERYVQVVSAKSAREIRIPNEKVPAEIFYVWM